MPLPYHLEIKSSVIQPGPLCVSLSGCPGELHTDHLGSSCAANPGIATDIALINFPLLLLWVVAHPDFSTPPLVTLLRFLLQFSACCCKIQQSFLFGCDFFKVY